MKSGWLRELTTKQQNHRAIDGKRKNFSRIEERIRHRRQQLYKNINIAEQKISDNDFTNYIPFSDKKSCSQFSPAKLDTSGSDENLLRLHAEEEKIELTEMTHPGPFDRRPKNLWKIDSKNKNRNRSPRFPVVRPQSAPCNLLFRIKCAKQVKSVKVLDEGKSFSDEKFETRSTRSACSTTRSQDRQIASPTWQKEIGELSLPNESFEKKKFKLFKDIPNINPRSYRNSDELLESSGEKTDNSQDVFNRQLILKGCEDDFSDGPLSSPERISYQTRRYKWDKVLEKQHCLSHSPLVVTRPRSEHLGIKCCGFSRYRHCSCTERSSDSEPFELCLKKGNNINENQNRVEDSCKNKTTPVSTEDAACSPRRPSFCHFDSQDARNYHSYNPEDPSPMTTRSVSTQVENSLIFSARDTYDIRQNHSCQYCVKSNFDDHYMNEEVAGSSKCAKCGKSLKIENIHQDCRRCIASEKRKVHLNSNTDSNIKHGINCICKELHTKSNSLERQKQIFNHGTPTCYHTTTKNDNVNCSRDKAIRNDCSCEHFCCEQKNDTYCSTKINLCSGRKPFYYPPIIECKSAREISSQTGFRPRLCNRENVCDDGTEKENFQRNIDRRFHCDALASCSKVHSQNSGRSSPNKWFSRETGEKQRLSFCNDIMNKHQDILRSCMRNQQKESETHLNIERTLAYSESDNEWSVSPDEDISGNRVIFPKETRYAMNYLRLAKENSPQKEHLKRAPREQIVKQETEDEQDNFINETKNGNMYRSAFTKALAVFQKGCVSSAPTDFKGNRKHYQKNDIGGK